MPEYTNVEEQVEFAAGQIDPERKVEVSLRDLMYVYATIGEFVSFFHQPLHFQSLDDVLTFIGDRDQGALHLLWEVYYGKLSKVWPEDVQSGFDEGIFDHPQSPYYFESRGDEKE